MDASKLEEYDYYLRGHSIFFEFTPEALLKAREIFQEGLQKFPDSGLMRVKIGWTHFQFFYLGLSSEPERRSEEHTSELQSLMRSSYAVFCLKKKTNKIKE